MVNKYYKGVRNPGNTLWDAIVSKYQHDNPPQISSWIEGQMESYLDEDWDEEWINNLKWDYRNEMVIAILQKISKVRMLTINRLKQLRLKNEDKIEINKFVTYIEKNQSKRNDWAYQRASDDFDDCIKDIEVADDKQVAEFFNIELEVTGFDIEGYEYPFDEVIICPICGEANRIADIGKSFECRECIDVSNFNDADFLNANQHLKPEVLVAMAINQD